MVGSAPVDAARAIADLTEISSQIEEVVLVDGDGAVLGSNLDDDARAQRLADGARRLVDAAAAHGEVAQLEAATAHGSVFVVREDGRTIVATTGLDPTVGLVFYDLKTALRALDPPKQRAPRKRKQANGAAA